jgi:hypothetical protein
VTGDLNTGGLVGQNNNRIIDSTVTVGVAGIRGTNSIGGFVGNARAGRIENGFTISSHLNGFHGIGNGTIVNRDFSPSTRAQGRTTA